MSDLLSVFGNATLQAFIFSPLMGIVFAVLFSGLSKPASPTVRTVTETRRIYVEKHYYRSSRRASNDDDGRGIVFLLGIALLFVVWQYALHALLIQQTLIAMLTTSVYFSVISMFIALWKGHFTSSGWVVSLAIPGCILATGLLLAFRAKNSFPIEVTELANQYEFIQFYLSGLNDYGRYYMITHVTGMVCLFLLALVSVMSFLHHLALMNQRDETVNFGLWEITIRVSAWASGGRGALLVVLLVLGAWLLLEGYVVRWIM